MAWRDLFSTDYGLMSVAVIGFTIVMGAFLYRKVTRLMNESAQGKR